MELLVSSSRLWHKGYDVNLDYGAYYGFHIVYGNTCRLNHIGCDVVCLADCYRLLIEMFLANKY